MIEVEVVKVKSGKIKSVESMDTLDALVLLASKLEVESRFSTEKAGDTLFVTTGGKMYEFSGPRSEMVTLHTFHSFLQDTRSSSRHLASMVASSPKTEEYMEAHCKIAMLRALGTATDENIRESITRSFNDIKTAYRQFKEGHADSYLKAIRNIPK